MRQSKLVVLAATLACALPGLAEESAPTAEKSEEELAKESQNPVADLYSFPFQDNIGLNYGPAKGVQNVLNFQPVIPFHLGPLNLITRTIIPLVTNPYLNEEQSGATGLGDINVTAFSRPRHPVRSRVESAQCSVFPPQLHLRSARNRRGALDRPSCCSRCRGPG